MAETEITKQHGTRKLTVRIERRRYLSLKELADSEGATVSALVADAVAQFTRKIQREDAIRRIKELQKEMLESGQVGPDSVKCLREAREERAEHLASLCEPSRPEQ